MAIRLNVFCNGQVAQNRNYLDKFDRVKWNPGAVKRDALGIPISYGRKDMPMREVGKDADLQK